MSGIASSAQVRYLTTLAMRLGQPLPSANARMDLDQFGRARNNLTRKLANARQDASYPIQEFQVFLLNAMAFLAKVEIRLPKTALAADDLAVAWFRKFGCVGAEWSELYGITLELYDITLEQQEFAAA